MSLNDFDTVPTVDSDEQIISKVGGAVRAALSAKESLSYALTEAIDSSTTFGYELGSEDMKVKIIELFEKSDSSCSDWAIAQIQDNF